MTLPTSHQIWLILELASGWSILAFVDACAVIIVVRMATGKINLSRLISEPTGDASMSRFQLLIFTYVISLSLFMISLQHDPPGFPDITGGLLSLLGISASTYAVSKGIQYSTDSGIAEKAPVVEVTPRQVTIKSGGTATVKAQVTHGVNQSVNWTTDSNGGTLTPKDQAATFIAPAVNTETQVRITAASAQNPSVSDVAIVTIEP